MPLRFGTIGTIFPGYINDWLLTSLFFLLLNSKTLFRGLACGDVSNWLNENLQKLFIDLLNVNIFYEVPEIEILLFKFYLLTTNIILTPCVFFIQFA